MTEGIKKFAELMNTDEAFQAKLSAAMQSYKGEMTPEAVYNDVLSPLAKEYGISVSLEEFNDYISSQTNGDEALSFDELEQVAGGKETVENKGHGSISCAGIGGGLGGGGGNGVGGGCLGVGFGWGHSSCLGEGKGTTL